jgi:O-antigen/teichoic acid export membrane protein
MALFNHLPKKFIGPGLISLAIKIAGAVLAYCMIVAFAHLMPLEEYGRFAFGLNLAIVCSTIAGFGFATGIMRYWPNYMASGDAAGGRGAVLLGYAACAFGGLAILAIAIVFGAWSGISNEESRVVEYAAISALGLVIALSDYSANTLRAQGSTIVSLLPRDVLWRILSIAGVAALFYAGQRITGTTAIFISAACLSILVAWQILVVNSNLSNVPARYDWTKIKPSLMPLWASGIVFAMIQQFDVVIIGTLLDAKDAGPYFAAQKTAMLLSLVLIAAGLVAAPSMAALYHSGKHEELQKLCRNLAKIIAAVTALGFLALAVLGKFLLSLFDANFVSAYPILLVVALGTMIDAVAGPTAYLMQMTTYEKAYLRIMVVCYGFVLLAQFILIPRYGSMGAAMASTGGIVIWNLWAVALLRRQAGLDPSLLSLIVPPRKTIIDAA